MGGKITNYGWNNFSQMLLLWLVVSLGILSILATGGNGGGSNPGTLQFSTTAYSVDEASGTITISVTRIRGSDGAASVDLSDAGSGSATSGTDYTAISTTTLNWASGDAGVKTFDISVTDDSIYETNETVVLALSNASGASLGSVISTTVTIIDDDAVAGTLQFGNNAYSGNEDAGPITVMVTRTGGSDGAASVQINDAGGGSATPGTDYTAITTTTLNWASGDNNPKSFDVTITADGTIEADETVNLVLSNATGASLGTPDSSTVTILNDDAASPGSIQFSLSNFSVAEDAGVATIGVTRTGGSAGIVGVTYASSDDTAIAGDDYTAVSSTLAWANGDSLPKTFDVPIINDTDVEVPESLNLTLSVVTGGATLGTPSTATLTINSEDRFGTIGFRNTSYTVGEADGTVNNVIALERADGSSGPVSVDVLDTGAGSATSGTDYNAISLTTISWTDGDVSDKYIGITLINDSDVEGTETVNLALENTTGGAGIGANNAATVNISDDDTLAVGELQFDSASYAVDEAAGTTTITVNRINGTAGIVGVSFATSDGTATAGADYIGNSGTLSWGDGVGGAQTFTVTISDDAIVEVPETVSLTLSSPTGGATLVSPSTAILTINSNDTNLTMNIGQGGKWVAFQDGPSGDWTVWSPTSGNTYNFPVTDGQGRYGVAVHTEENDGTFIAQKTYVFHATLGEIADMSLWHNPRYTISGSLDNLSGTNDSAEVYMQLSDDGAEPIITPYAYSLIKIPQGTRDLIAYEWNITTDATGNFVRRTINVTGDLSGQDVDFTNDGEAVTQIPNEFHGGSGSTGQYLEAYYSTGNGTSFLIASGNYDGVTAIEYPYITNSSMVGVDDSYSFQVSKTSGSKGKYRVRNRVADTNPGNLTIGLGSLANLSIGAVNSASITGLSYTPDPTSFNNSPVFRAFQVDLDQTVTGVSGGAHWQIKISKGWLGSSSSYSFPTFLGLSGYDAGWDLTSGINTIVRTTAITSNNGTGLRLIYRKTVGRGSNNHPEENWIVSHKLAHNNSLRLDMAHDYYSGLWQ